MRYLFLLLGLFLILNCKDSNARKLLNHNNLDQDIPEVSIQNSNGATIIDRFLPPQNYERIEQSDQSFATYLRHLPLKPENAQVKYYNGDAKSTSTVYVAVVDLPIGHKDLHQCADAVMRLKAEYHWKNKEYDKIHFNFTNGFRVDYTEWMKGRRMVVNGNKTSWNDMHQPSNSYEDFWGYMELIFMYAGTASLAKEIKSINLNDMKIGDVLIKGGHPGHAVIIVDMATESSSGKKMFMLAQSYMPAQELQILQNHNNIDISPWYELQRDQQINTPEWTFEDNQLKRFQE